MRAFIRFADALSAAFGKVFAWGILVMTVGITYEVIVRYAFRAPTSWAFDLSYILYGALFTMAGAYTLSRDGHVRADFLYRLMRPRTQASLDLLLYVIFFFPGILALVFAGWKYASRSIRYLEVSNASPAGIPIWQFKLLLVAAGILLLVQGVAQAMRCLICIREGRWPAVASDVEELEKVLLEQKAREALHHPSEPIDVPDSAAVRRASAEGPAR